MLLQLHGRPTKFPRNSVHGQRRK